MVPEWFLYGFGLKSELKTLIVKLVSKKTVSIF